MLEINFLEHCPSGPPAPKIWWSSSISGGPVNFLKIVSEYTTLLNNFWLGNFSGLPNHFYPLFSTEKKLITIFQTILVRKISVACQTTATQCSSGPAELLVASGHRTTTNFEPWIVFIDMVSNLVIAQ